MIIRMIGIRNVATAWEVASVKYDMEKKFLWINAYFSLD